MAKEPKQLDELFHDTLKDIYYAEKKILSALPKMAKAAQNEDLTRRVREASRPRPKDRSSRLEQVFELIDEKPQGKKCAAIEGIIEEGQEIMKEYKGSPALDAGLLVGRAGGRALRDLAATARCAPGPRNSASTRP